MRTTMRFGIAAAAALAFTPSARPCDPQAYDPKEDAPRAQECLPEEASQARAVLPSEQHRAPVDIDRAESRDLGSGSGEPAPAAQPDQKQADQADELQRIWTSP